MTTKFIFEKQLQRDSVTPLYHQLYEILRENIENGIWKPGDMIPTEAELNEQYDISQITIRKALDILVEAGLIYRQRGKGSFVAQKSIMSSVTHLLNFATDMKQRGHSFKTTIVDTGIVNVSKNTADLLQIQVDDELAKIERLRFADEEPLSVEKTFLVHKYCYGILQYDFAERSLSEVLQQEYGIFLARAEQTIWARSAGEENARLLNVTPDAPLLAIERVSYSQNNIPVEFLRIVYRADRYKLHSELQGIR